MKKHFDPIPILLIAAGWMDGACLYCALCAQAELRAKLSLYEDTGLGPEEITEVLEDMSFWRFGKTVFLTREEAEAALKRVEEDKL